MVCALLPTVNDCWTCGAALKLALPAWLASITHVPAPVNERVAPEIEHTADATGSIVKLTVSPEVAVAATVYVAPPTVALAGAVDVTLMVCAPLPTANDCWTCGAAL